MPSSRNQGRPLPALVLALLSAALPALSCERNSHDGRPATARDLPRSEPLPPATPAHAAGEPQAPSLAAAASPAERALAAWRALTASPPDLVAASAVLSRPDATDLRNVPYSVPDSTVDTVQLLGTRVVVNPTTSTIPIFRALRAWVHDDPQARTATLVGFDHLLAGVMNAAPVPNTSQMAILTGRMEPGMAYSAAATLRMPVLAELVKIGEPAAYHSPQVRLDAVHAIVRAYGRNQPVPAGPVP